MRRRHFHWIGAATAGLALLTTACSGGGTGGGLDADSGLGSGDREVVTFAAAMFAESGRGPKLEALVQKFNQSQDKIEVKPATVPYPSFASTIFTQMGGGGGPDLIRFDITEFYTAIESKLLAPLDDVIDESKYDLLPPDKYTKVDGTRYGVMFEISNYALLYNPKLIKGQPPKTFDEFLASAKSATANGAYGFGYRTTMPEQAGFWSDLSNFVYGFGGRWSSPDGTPTINSPEVVRAVNAYKQVYDAKVTPQGADASTYRRMFGENKLAMEIDNGGVPPILFGQNPKLTLAAAPSPFPTKAQGQILTPLVINAKSKHKAAAATFIKWLLEPDKQAELQRLLGAGNPATKVARTAEELKQMPFLTVYDAQTPHGVPFVPEGLEAKTPEFRQIVIEQMIRVLQSGLDPQTAMDQAQDKVLAEIKN